MSPSVGVYKGIAHALVVKRLNDPLSHGDWLLVLVLSLSILPIIELAKLLGHRLLQPHRPEVRTANP